MVGHLRKLTSNIIPQLRKAKEHLYPQAPAAQTLPVGSIVVEADLVTNETEIEAKISKIRDFATQVEKIYGLSEVGGWEEKDLYEFFCKDRGAEKCPRCNYSFGKKLQRAKCCPHCGEYLSVRYGHVLTTPELEQHGERRRALVLTRIGVPNRIDEIRMCERHGAHDTAERISAEIIQQLVELIK